MAPGTKMSADYVTRAFGHLMDLRGAKEGTWIVGCLFLDSAPTYEDLKNLVKDKLLPMSRFKSVLKVNRFGGSWYELDELDWDYHLNVALENEVVSQEKLLEYVGSLLEQDLRTDKPLWKFTLIPKMDNGQACFLTVINHAIGDGVACIGVLLKMLDDAPIDPDLPAKDQKGFVPSRRLKGPSVPLSRRLKMIFPGIRDGLFGTVQKHDPPNSLKMKGSLKAKPNKLLAIADQIPLDKVKEIKVKFEGATINDILLAIMTMSVRSYLEEIEDPIVKKKTMFGRKASPIRGNFPVSLRDTKKPILRNKNPTNYWTPLSFRFPFDWETGADCVWKVKTQIDELKVSPQLPVQYYSAGFMMRLIPRWIYVSLLIRLNKKVTAMLSNVPGPQTKVHLAGSGIEDLMFFLFSPLGIYLGLISYNGKVSMGINMDPQLNQDPNEIAKYWKLSFEKLYEETMKYPGMIAKNKDERNATGVVATSPDTEQ